MVADPYRWLEDQTSPETRAWIDAQNRCAESALRRLPGRDSIARRLTELMNVESIGVPIERNGKYFFLKRTANQDLDVLEMREGPAGSDEVLLDPQPLSADHTTSVALRDVTRDGRRLVYGLRRGGEDETTLQVLDTDTRRSLPDELPRAVYFSVRFLPDDSGFFYVRMTAEGPRVLFHSLGTPAGDDPVIFGKVFGQGWILACDLSEDGRYLLYTASFGAGRQRSEIYVQDRKGKRQAVAIVRGVNAFFTGEIAGEKLYLLTDWKAPNWRVLEVNLRNPARERWREIVPETDARLEDFRIAGGKLIALYTRNAVSELRVFDLDGRNSGKIPLPGLGSVRSLSARPGSDELFFAYESFDVPPRVYRYFVPKHSLEVWAQPEVPVESGAFEVTQAWYESKDATRVPMFLFYRRGLRLDGSNPALLTGYGGFDVSETPRFREEALVWAERGGVYAVANLRGGGEFGEAWHRAGMLGNKQKVFDDFLAAAEWLVRNGYTRPSRLAIQGMSNGGLLVGAALTQRPDLFRAVVCLYPLLDMIRYQKFFVARWWIPEYGSSENAAQFRYLLAYSPYQHVQAGRDYPAVLFITGDGDTRVAPLHARKTTARLQAATASGRPVLLLYDTKSGHSGGRPRNKQIEEGTDILSFLDWQLGVAPGASYP